MFNPLTNDTKVAVTTTSANHAYTRLFTNYNGRKRPDNVGYHVLRADRPQYDVSLTDAYVYSLVVIVPTYRLGLAVRLPLLGFSNHIPSIV